MATTAATYSLNPTTLPVEKMTQRAVDRALGDRVPADLKEAAGRAIAPWAKRWVRLLDETLKIPGTSIHIGLDPVIGFLVPGAGDVITGAGSMGLLWLAFREGVPTLALFRMCANILIDTILGLLPVVGDAFDLVWRSNRRNLDLIERYRVDPKAKPALADYLLLGLGFTLAFLSIIVPIVIFYGAGLAALIGLSQFFG